MKKLLSFFLGGLIFCSVLAGCSNKTGLNPNDPVVLTIWHVYGSQTSSPMNDVIDEFNRTAGKETGVFVKTEMVTDSDEIDHILTANLQGEPGAYELPDLFVAYPRIAEQFGEDVLLDFRAYFSEEELSAYRSDFLSEGYFGGEESSACCSGLLSEEDPGEQLLMLPIAKSSELIFVNKTIFDRFSADTGITTDCFHQVETLMEACNAYCDWSQGQTMFQINDFYHYFLTNMAGLDRKFITGGKINSDSDAFAKVFAPIAEAAIYGGLCVGDGYASDRWKTGEIIGSAGSTAGILYMRDYVTYEDNTTEEIETLVLPYPCLEGSKPTAIQRGGGLFAVKNEDERKNQAAAIFAKWLAKPEHNLAFVTKAGYLPVTSQAFQRLFDDISSVENEKYRMLYSAINQQYENDYQFCSLPLFDGALEMQKNFETLIKSVLSNAHAEYLRRTQAGEDGKAVLDELAAASLAAVRAALR